MMNDKRSAARLVVQCLQEHGVEYVFGIPGAKIDAVFDALHGLSKPRLIVCRHEQNATFMAACIGRLTGTPGVVIATSGPGVSNLATGLITATTEGDPVVALGGAVPRSMKLKQTHQSMDNVGFAAPLTKSSVEVEVAESIPEVLANAFREASRARPGAAFVSLPQDVLAEEVSVDPLRLDVAGSVGPAPRVRIEEAARLLQQAKRPVLFLGLGSSTPANVEAVHRLLAHHPMPTIETFEAAGALTRELAKYFAGRVGLFRNQPGDRLLREADLVLTVGFDPVEFDPEVWNAEESFEIIHLADEPLAVGHRYCPRLELSGDIAATLDELRPLLAARSDVEDPDGLARLRAALDDGIEEALARPSHPIHPLRFIHDLQTRIDENTTVISDVGSHYMWLARHLYCYRARHLLFSNGQQTLGVALPWAMATTLARPQEKVISISGDGGFLFSAMELETAVREKCNFVHFVWRDGHYNMVAEQEQTKYGRTTGVDFGEIDLVGFAESFGARRFALGSADELLPVLDEAQSIEGPVLIDVPIDYSDNPKLFEMADVDGGH